MIGKHSLLSSVHSVRLGDGSWGLPSAVTFCDMYFTLLSPRFSRILS